MALITGISLIAAFIGGMVALFAPCCITFLLPSYLGNIFKNKEKVVSMTLIFGLGIATILVPTALGIKAIGQIFQNFHTQTYVVGGILMIVLGVLNIAGKKITLPMINLSIDLTKHNDPWSVYVLGVFSGITSSCCTPVLMGVLTLTFLSPSFFWATLAGLSYVAGMVTPLIILALLLEKINWSKLTKVRTKTVNIFNQTILLTDVVAGLIFLSIGILFIYLALTGQIVMGSTGMVEQTMGLLMTNLVSFSRQLPFAEYLFLAILVIGIIYLIKKMRGKS